MSFALAAKELGGVTRRSARALTPSPTVSLERGNVDNKTRQQQRVAVLAPTVLSRGEAQRAAHASGDSTNSPECRRSAGSTVPSDTVDSGESVAPARWRMLENAKFMWEDLSKNTRV